MTDESVSLCVTLDHEDGVVRAQTWLKGKVHVKVSERTTMGIGTLTLDLAGKELTSIDQQPERMRKPGTTTRLSDEHVVFEETQTIRGLDVAKTLLNPGAHCYPFSFYMPGHLPPSMHFKGENGDSCSVQYTLTAKLGTVQQSTLLLTVVGKPLSCKHYPCLVGPTCVPVKSKWYGILDHGFVVLAAKIDNQHVAKGRAFHLTIAGRNKSREQMERVDTHVVQEMEWKTGSHRRRKTITLDTYKDVRRSGLVLDVDRASGGQNDNEREEEATKASVLQELSSAKNVLQVQVSSRAFDSYCGTLVRISHALKVAVIARGRPQGACEITVPLQVYDPPVETVHPKVVPSAEKTAEIVATVWPSDQKLLEHQHCRTDSHASCSSINENEAVVE